MATYGKVVGGGLPIGLVSGDARFLDGVDGGAWSYGDDSAPQAIQTFFAGTFCKHPLALAAARAALGELRRQGPGLQERLNATTAGLVADLEAWFRDHEVPIHTSRFASLFRLAFRGAPQAAALFPFHMRLRGIHMLEDRSFFLSTAHDEADLDRVRGAVIDSVEALRRDGFLPARPTVAAGGGEPETRRSEETLAPMTEGQRGLWAVCRLSDEANAAFNESLALRLRGDLDVHRLRTALARLVKRHEALRTGFDAEGDGQHVHADGDLALPLIDLGAHPETLDERMAEEIRRPLDLEHPPLARARLFRLRDDEHVLLLVVHHLVSDSWSFDVLFTDLHRFYAALGRGEEPKLRPAVSYRDYAARRRAAGDEERRRAEEHWLAELTPPPPPLELPLDHPRPRVQSYAGEHLEMALGADEAAALRRAVQASGATGFAVMLGTFYLLLHAATGQSDLVAGFHSAGQATVGERDLVGFCIDMLPLRLAIEPDESTHAYLRRVQGKVLGSHGAQAFPFASVVRRLGLRRDPGRPPLVSVIFNLDRGGEVEPRLGDLEAELIATPVHCARFELLWNVTDSGDALSVECTYNRDLFAAATVRSWLDLYRSLLHALAGEEEAPPTVAAWLDAAREHRRRALRRRGRSAKQKLEGRFRQASRRTVEV
jgi:hypothetical protein